MILRHLTIYEYNISDECTDSPEHETLVGPVRQPMSDNKLPQTCVPDQSQCLTVNEQNARSRQNIVARFTQEISIENQTSNVYVLLIM